MYLLVWLRLVDGETLFATACDFYFPALRSTGCALDNYALDSCAVVCQHQIGQCITVNHLAINCTLFKFISSFLSNITGHQPTFIVFHVFPPVANDSCECQKFLNSNDWPMQGPGDKHSLLIVYARTHYFHENFANSSGEDSSLQRKVR